MKAKPFPLTLAAVRALLFALFSVVITSVQAADVLYLGDRMNPGQQIWSPQQRYFLLMQSDG